MRTHFSKIAFLFGLYGLLHVAEACKDHKCPDLLPFFDYSALKVTAIEPSATDIFHLEIHADSVNYLSVAQPRSEFNLIQSSYAHDCGWDGFDGPKHSITKFNVYADRAFNDTLPAGTSLNPLFFGNGGDYLLKLQPDESYDNFWAFGDGAANIRPIKVYCFEKPRDLEVPFVFRVEIVKANGDILEASTEAVVFH